MSFYSSFYLQNTSGYHTFDGIVLTKLLGYNVVKKATHIEGAIYEVKDMFNQVIKEVLVHKNEQDNTDDLNKLAVLASIKDIASLPEDIQDTLFFYERVPGGGYRTL